MPNPDSLPRLSKSKLVAALQCERKLWLAVNQPDAEVADAERQFVFAVGHRVGEMARRLATQQHGTGELIDIEGPLRWPGGLQRCIDALAEPGLKVLFEAPFAADGLAVLCDIVIRHAGPAGEVWLVEVKSSTGIEGKPYVDDAAFQAWAMAKSGHPPDRVFIRVIDKSFVYPGHGDYRGLFRGEDVTAAVRERLPHVPKLLAVCRTSAAGPEPEVRTGPPPEYPVALLGRRNTG